MQSSAIRIFLFSFIFFPQSLDASMCQGFSPDVYNAPRDLISKWHREFVTSFDNRAAVLLHQLILNSFDPAEAESICSQKDVKMLVNVKVGIMKLAALHVAAMVGNIDALKWLIQHGAQVNEQDIHGYTPSHFAALQQKSEALDFLESEKADLTILNEFGATPKQVWKLTHLFNAEISFMHDFSRTISQIEEDEYCILTGTTFLEGIKILPEDLLYSWRTGDVMTEPSELQKITSHLKNFHPVHGNLYLKRISKLAFGQHWTVKDYGLYSGTNFQRGDIVEITAGIWKSGRKDLVDGTSGFETSEFRGYLPYAAVGLPNIVILPFAKKLGLRDGSFAIAIHPIKNGDPIVLDYPSAPTNLDIGTEIDPDGTDAFLKKTPLSKLLLAFRNDKSLNLGEMKTRAELLYISRRPHVFIRLLAEEKASLRDLRSFVELGLLDIAFQDENNRKYSANGWFFESVEKHFKHDFVRKYFSARAREGKISILLMTIQTMRLREIESISSLHTLWNSVHRGFCSEPENFQRAPMTCSGVLYQ